MSEMTMAEQLWEDVMIELRLIQGGNISVDDFNMNSAEEDELWLWCDDLEARMGYDVSCFAEALGHYIDFREG